MRRWMNLGLALLVVASGAVAVPASAAEEGPQGRFRVAGELTAVDEAGDSIELVSRRGQDWAINLTSETTYRSPGGEVEGPIDLAVGMKVLVLGSWDDGKPVARVVAAAWPRDLKDLGRTRGRVVEVDARQQSFTLETRAGDSLRLLVSDETRFHSRGGEVDGLEDIEPGWHAGALYRETERGLEALRVVVAPPRSGRPRLDVRARGEIGDVDEGVFTIVTREGERITFHLTEAIVIRAPGGGLTVGMRAWVAGKENDNGEAVALIVVAIRAPKADDLSQLDPEGPVSDLRPPRVRP